jgi:uncharacterized membrane protein YhiD involved in acid resistance
MPAIADPNGLERLAVATLIGFLVGIDRERAEVRKGRALVGGGEPSR